jgi:hypothetical protein
MITLLFLICSDLGCSPQVWEQTFKTQEACIREGESLITRSKDLIASGDLPPHTANFKCIEWGTPA